MLLLTQLLTAILAANPPTPPLVIEPRLMHLRNDPSREWSSFPAQAEAAHLETTFTMPAANDGEFAFRLRQQDVKQAWRVSLNGKPLGPLAREEADLVIYLPVPAGALAAGENTLRIESPARGAQSADDIRVGEIRLQSTPVNAALAEATLEVEVVDADSNRPLPARITIADANGSRHMVNAASSDSLAVRPGVIYTASGQARFGIPAGKYTVDAGRGFEYSLAKAEVTLVAGGNVKQRLAIRREVDTPGYVACDTHIHTLTHSGHGDASLDERMITLTGEGIELPIATDHNIHIDYEAAARRLGVRQYFTPVIGNEVTTPAGHFNIFPVEAGARLPNHRSKDWAATFGEIFSTPGAKVAILNHARDIHSGVRPFGPVLFNAAIGQNIAGWPLRMNAMEVINSGATQTDPLRLPRDWMALLNAGYSVTPVGSSDSHDVARYIVGQGRTYIRCSDADVSQIDVNDAVNSFLQGRVLVSYGLLAELSVNGKYMSGEFAALAGDEVDVEIRVLGPSWARATRVLLFANGEVIREEAIPRPAPAGASGVQYAATWKLPRPKHDVHLVAIALGDGIDGPFWATAKPYQPTSPDWQPYTLGISGAVWLDADSDGRRSSARDYARQLMVAANGDTAKLIAALAGCDAPTAAQAADLLHTAGQSLDDPQLTTAIKSAPKHVANGFSAYRQALRDSELAK